jgi:hypothetical protein
VKSVEVVSIHLYRQRLLRRRRVNTLLLENGQAPVPFFPKSFHYPVGELRDGGKWTPASAKNSPWTQKLVSEAEKTVVRDHPVKTDRN